MSDHTTQRTIIYVSPQQCFDVATDFDRYPEWASDVKHVSVEHRDEQGRGGDVTYRAAAMGRSTTYTLRYYYGSNPLRIAWRLVEGDLTRRLDGEYEFVPLEVGQTEVVYHLEVDLVVPIPGFVKRRAESRIIRTALDDLRRRVEAKVTS
jgi:ribosome-associated toxin RatA of RatAB toxin-antitoxin module